MKKVVVIGGGTGNFVVLSGLKKYPLDISAIVSMADDGGSTGRLRDELGVLPPGDVRQCLVALSDSSRLMRDLMNYRFSNGALEGHSFGNIFLSTLEKVTGSFEKAVEEVGKILAIKGKVIPATTNQVRLKMVLSNGTQLNGEDEVYKSENLDQGCQTMYLEPEPRVDTHAISEIMTADCVIIAPGGLYNSLIPVFLVQEISRALEQTKAKKIIVSNLMNRKGQTSGFKLSKFIKEMSRFIGKDIFDYILVNNTKPSPEMLKKYEHESEFVINDMQNDSRVIEADLISSSISQYSKSDALNSLRALIRHDSNKLAKVLTKIINQL
jgi:uncharacterized cofD-like protein